MKPVAVILNDKELVRLLTHLGLSAEYPKFKPVSQASLYEHACGPPVCVRCTGRPDEDARYFSGRPPCWRADPRIDYEAIEPAPPDD